MIARLDEVFNLQMGKTPSRNNTDYWINGQYDWISIADLGGYQKYVEKTKEKISALAVQESGIKSVPANTVIMSFKLSLGKTAITKNPVYTNEAIMAFIPTGRYAVLPDYFYYLFSARDWTKGTNRAVMGTTLNKATLGAISIEVPPLDEQRCIAATLDKVTDLISKRRQQLDKLDELVKARFVEMFGDKDYPYKELISLIKDGAGLSYGIVQPGEDGSGNMGVLRPVDLVNGKIDTTSIKYIDRSLGEGFKKTELNGNELLISVRGTTGITALTDDRFVGMNVTRGIAVIRYDNEKINPVYLNTYLNTDESQRYIREHTRGATLQQINLSDLRIQQILVPPRDEQEQFSTFVEQTEKTKATISHSLEKLETLKKALMQEYFGVI